MKKKALVLGGSGFLGRFLIDELFTKDYEITALAHSKAIEESDKNINVFRASLEDFNWNALKKNLPDVIFHAARMSGKNKRARLKAARKNAEANERLLNWLKSLKNPPLLVYVSGTLVYGSHGRKPVDENTSPAPISFQREYFVAEKPILRTMLKNELPIMIMRPAWILGPGSWFRAFYLNYMREKNRVPVYGNGKNLMSFIHAADVAGKMIHASEKGQAGTIYNLFNGAAISQQKFAEMLSDYSGMEIKKVPEWWLKLRYDKALAEAFTFSLNVGTIHQTLWNDYQPHHPDMGKWLQEQINSVS